MIRVVDNDSTEHYGHWAWRCSLTPGEAGATLPTPSYQYDVSPDAHDSAAPRVNDGVDHESRARCPGREVAEISRPGTGQARRAPGDAGRSRRAAGSDERDPESDLELADRRPAGVRCHRR